MLLHSPEYPQKNLYTTDWKNFQPRLGIAYAINDKTVVHASAGIIDQGLNGLSTDWFSFYYNSITMNQTSTLNGEQWVSELGPDHRLGTFPLQSSGANLGYYPAISTNAAYGYQTFGQLANPDQGGASTINHFQSPEDYVWDASIQRQVGKSWVATVDYTGVRGIHLLMPVWGWSTNNVPLQDYSLGQSLYSQVPNPFYGQSQTFASEPTVQLSPVAGTLATILLHYAGTGQPGDAPFANFLNMQIQSRGYHGLTLLASYSIRKTLTNSWGNQHSAWRPGGQRIAAKPARSDGGLRRSWLRDATDLVIELLVRTSLWAWTPVHEPWQRPWLQDPQRSRGRLESRWREHLESERHSVAGARCSNWSDCARGGASLLSADRSKGCEVHELFQRPGKREQQTSSTRLPTSF